MVLICVVDFETSSFEPDARVVEAVALSVNTDHSDHDVIMAQLHDPGEPISPLASAVHHLTAADVTGRSSYDPKLWRLAVTDVFCAHYADFDRRFVDDPRPWIDTWRCAIRVWPEAPAHGNQVLRYWLGLDLDLPPDLHPHRALYDAITTAGILRRLLAERTVDELIAISAEPALLPRIGFGKHRGLRYEAVPRDYLRWILGTDLDEHVKHTARYWLSRGSDPEGAGIGGRAWELSSTRTSSTPRGIG